jgi:hypothetical protein
MAVSVYVALTADASGSHTPVIDAPCDGQESRFNNPSVQKMRKTRWRKAAPTDAPQKRSKKAKVYVDRALAASTPCSGSLLTADFAKSEWEIMYPLFMAEGLIDSPACVIRQNT